MWQISTSISKLWSSFGTIISLRSNWRDLRAWICLLQNSVSEWHAINEETQVKMSNEGGEGLSMLLVSIQSARRRGLSKDIKTLYFEDATCEGKVQDNVEVITEKPWQQLHYILSHLETCCPCHIAYPS